MKTVKPSTYLRMASYPSLNAKYSRSKADQRVASSVKARVIIAMSFGAAVGEGRCVKHTHHAKSDASIYTSKGRPETQGRAAASQSGTTRTQCSKVAFINHSRDSFARLSLA